MVRVDTQKVKDRGPWLAARSGRAFIPWMQAPLWLRATVPHKGCGVTFQKALALPHQGIELQEGPAGPSHETPALFPPIKEQVNSQSEMG